jgi:predicted transcriptional regulator
MGGKNKRKLTRFEMEIMGALWEIGQASVREIQERLPKRDRPAYTTVQTIVRRLQERGPSGRSRQSATHSYSKLRSLARRLIAA